MLCQYTKSKIQDELIRTHKIQVEISLNNPLIKQRLGSSTLDSYLTDVLIKNGVSVGIPEVKSFDGTTCQVTFKKWNNGCATIIRFFGIECDCPIRRKDWFFGLGEPLDKMHIKYLCRYMV